MKGNNWNYEKKQLSVRKNRWNYEKKQLEGLTETVACTKADIAASSRDTFTPHSSQDKLNTTFVAWKCLTLSIMLVGIIPITSLYC